MNIGDIAKLCGVSPSTVSKILHNKDGGISAETRKKVLAVVKEYQFVPYSKALSQNPARSGLVGLLVDSLEAGRGELVAAVEEVFAGNGYSTILCNARGDQEKAEKYLHILHSKNADGVLLAFQSRKTAEACAAPAAAIWGKRAVCQNPRVAHFTLEEGGAEYLGTAHLLQQDHRKIGYILRGGGPGVGQGYLKALGEYGLQPSRQYIFQGASLEEITRVHLSQCLNTDVTAVLCGDLEVASRVYARLRERGDRVPGDLSLVALGGGPRQVLCPPPTQAGVDMARLGRAAAQDLIDMIEAKKDAYTCGGAMKAEIFAGESVAPPRCKKQGGKLVVVGSMNMDCSISVPYLPTDGETLLSGSITRLPGGKGGNQAVGAGKLGGLVYMIGCLGNDADGKALYDSLAGNGVRMAGVSFEPSLPTGNAYIHVAPDGESSIVVYPGANNRLERGLIKRNRQLFEGARYCLLPLEISQDTAEYTLRECERQGVGVIVKPSAVSGLKEGLYQKIEYFIPNEKELRQFVPGEMPLEDKAALLLEKGVKNVIVTLGKNGCYLRNRDYSRFFPAADFHSVDTTGAADAFIGALAVFLSEGSHLVTAIGYATYAAGISITRVGVQSAMVDRAGLEAYKDEILSRFKP